VSFDVEALMNLPLEIREAAARHYQRVAQMEHASVAAFARFALQLLQLGAPPELVERTTAAIADEARHARIAFGIARALSGVELGPAALDVEHSLAPLSLVDIVRLVVREGCIGETAAALEAREAAAHATQPSLCAMLDGIADDEASHAELAWRFVSWALERAPLEVATVLESEAARLDGASTPAASADELALAALGCCPKRYGSSCSGPRTRWSSGLARSRFWPKHAPRRVKSSPFSLIRCSEQLVLIRFSPGWLRSVSSRTMVRQF
jgi:hypothetical protein